MKKLDKNFPWYVLFSIYAFLALMVIPLPNKKPKTGLMKHFWITSLTFMFLPTLIMGIAMNWMAFIPSIIRTNILLATFYVSGIFAAYKHVEWRRKQAEDSKLKRDDCDEGRE